MSDKKLIELKSFTDGIKNRTLTNIKSIESSLMEIIQFYIKANNKNIGSQLDAIKTKILKLKDKVNTYRIPPILLKQDQKKSNFLNQMKIVIFYFELVFTESESLVEDFRDGTLNVKDAAKIQEIIENFSVSFTRIVTLVDQLEGFDKMGQFDKIFKIIGPKVKELYPKPRQVKHIVKLSKKLNLLKLEKEQMPTLYEPKKKEKKAEKGKVMEEIAEEQSTIEEVLNTASYKLYTKNQLIDIINKLAETPKIKDLGGMIEISKLYNLIKAENPDFEFTLVELTKAINHMKKRGFISNIESIKNLKLIEFAPIEISSDPKKLLEVIGPDGVETKENLMKKLNWSDARVEKVLKFLLAKGICRSDKDSMMGKKYYFPGLK